MYSLQGQGRRGNIFLCDNLDHEDNAQPARVALRFLPRQASNAYNDGLNFEISTHWCAIPLLPVEGSGICSAELPVLHAYLEQNVGSRIFLCIRSTCPMFVKPVHVRKCYLIPTS